MRYALVVFVLLPGGLRAAPVFDLIIRGGTIIDGTGQQRFRADVGIVGDTIQTVGNLEGIAAPRVIDATGQIVTPGFIDLHNHADDQNAGSKGLRSPDPRRRAIQNYVAQGVTTVGVNPDGRQPISLTEQRQELKRLGTGVNLILFNGHNTLREMAMGKDLKRPANAAEIAKMQDILRRGLEQEGSFGISLGTEYFSGIYSSTEEQIALGRVAAQYNGIFIPHIRSQGISPMWWVPSENKGKHPPTLADAVEEVLRVAKESGVVTVFTHMKAWGPGFRDDAEKWIARLQEVRDAGGRVYMDVYPYDSSGSDGNFIALPGWAIGGTRGDAYNDSRRNFRAALQATLKDASKLEDLRADIEHEIALKGGPENVRILDHPNPQFVGKSLAELMAQRGGNLTDLVIALQLEGDPFKAGGAKMRSFSMSEKDIEAFYKLDWCATATDGAIVLPEEAVGPAKYIGTNRRYFGSFPRRLAHYSRDRHVDTLEHAVRSASGLPAMIVGLADRGRIAPGMKADIAVIDINALKDNTTFLEPNEYATGVNYLLVNGRFTIDAARRTLALPGRVLDPVGRPARLAKAAE